MRVVERRRNDDRRTLRGQGRRDQAGLGGDLDAVAAQQGADLSTDSGRYACREAIAAVLEPWFADRDLGAAERALSEAGVLYGVYRDFRQLVAEDPRCSEENPLFSTIDQEGVGTVLAPRSPLDFGGSTAGPAPAHTLGHDTHDILTHLLHLTDQELEKLVATGVIKENCSSN